ncbi:MAG TPA: MEDS domain-containing protein [Burkholderiales bacterium]|jgi:hypothetical protein|nr:MEDS domain-containing protein [Burkholderiales bacterium]
MQESKMRHASWRELLASPPPTSHIVQIYDSENFVVGGVAAFAAEGLRRGEAVILTGTQAHLRGVEQALAAGGIDAEAAKSRGQLSLSDVDEAVRAVLVEGALDAERFQARVDDALARACADPRFSGVRWWGEMSNVLHQRGNDEDALRAEDLADAAAKSRGVTVFCSYLFDRFDPRSYDGMLRHVCGKHSHVIPAEDYVRHRLAVNRAIAEVVGDIKGPLLQSLLSWKGLACDLPSSQALLFWVRDALPEHFQDILSRARTYQLEEAT